jgi:hypothetical protein
MLLRPFLVAEDYREQGTGNKQVESMRDGRAQGEPQIATSLLAMTA